MSAYVTILGDTSKTMLPSYIVYLLPLDFLNFTHTSVT